MKKFKYLFISIFLFTFVLSLVGCKQNDDLKSNNDGHGKVINIKDALESKDGDKVTVHGRVIQEDFNSYILSDGTGEILVFVIKEEYENKNYQVGDEVKVTGIRDTYFNCKEMYPLLSSKEPLAYEPEVMEHAFDEAFLNKYLSDAKFNFLRGKLEGTLTITYNEELKDNDYMVKVGNLTVGIYGLDEKEKEAHKDSNGKEVVVDCFLYGYHDINKIIFASVISMECK